MRELIFFFYRKLLLPVVVLSDSSGKPIKFCVGNLTALFLLFCQQPTCSWHCSHSLILNPNCQMDLAPGVLERERSNSTAELSESACRLLYIIVQQLHLPIPVLVVSRDAACSCLAGQVFHHWVFPDGLLKWVMLKKFIQGVLLSSRLVISALISSQLPAHIVM